MSQEAKRRLSAVLSVLGGEMTPQQAAASLGVTANCYYLLETRAFEGMGWALEPRSRGTFRPSARELERKERENEQLRREVDRLRTLLRAAQRTMGLLAALPSKKGTPEGQGKRRKRRATARALRLKKVLHATSSEGGGAVAPAPLDAPSAGGSHG